MNVGLTSLFQRLPTLDQIQAERDRRQRTQETQQRVLDFYPTASLFAKNCILWPKNEQPTPYQYECWDLLAEHKRLSVRGPHGLGKTAWAAILVHWFALTRDAAGQDWKIPTTASAWRQLRQYLWPEIHKWAKRIKWWTVGRAPYDMRDELLMTELKLRYGSAFALASDVPELMEGAHADQILYLFDESKTIPSATFDAAEGAFSGGGGEGRCAYAAAVSTPGPPVGRFFDIHMRKPGYEDWCTRHVTLEEAIAAGRVTRQWAEQRKRQWGANSAIYKNRALGEFAESGTDGVIPVAWVEAAVERWYRWKEDSGLVEMLTSVGADIAWGESDHSDRIVFALRMGWVVPELRVYRKQGTMDTVGKLRGVISKYGGVALIDVIGAAGVYGRLKEQKTPVLPFNASVKASIEEDGMERPLTDKSGELQFANMRAAAWWRMRELLDPETGQPIALPPDDEENGVTLLQELTTPKWRVNSSGRIQIQEKEKIISELGRSPDCADAVVMAYALELLEPNDIPWEMWSPDDTDARKEEESDLEAYVKEHGVFWPNAGGR